MSFSAEKIHFLEDFSFVFRPAFWLKQLVLVEEFLREDKLEHGTFFLTTRNASLKKAASKPQGNFLLLSGQILEFKCE